MKRLVLVALLIASSASAQWFYGAAAPPGGSFTVVYDIDFDASGCNDSSSGDSCTTDGIPDCDAGVNAGCPIAGTYSLELDTSTEEAYYAGLTAITTDYVTMDFRFILDANDGGTSPLINLIGMVSAGGDPPNFDCNISIQPNWPRISARSNGGGRNGEVIIANDTQYYIRLEYQPTPDICNMWVWTGSWGGTLVGSGSHTGAVAGSIVGWGADAQGELGANEQIIDDLVICTSSTGANTSAGRCDTL